MTDQIAESNNESCLMWSTAAVYCRPTSLMVSPCRRTCSTIVLCISLGTTDHWPHPLHFSFLLLFPFVSHYKDSFSKTHNHLCSCSYHPEILTAVSSGLLLNVHTWMCRVLQKTLSKLERVCKQEKCVKSFEKRVFILRTVWMVWKIVLNESVIVC